MYYSMYYSMYYWIVILTLSPAGSEPGLAEGRVRRLMHITRGVMANLVADGACGGINQT